MRQLRILIDFVTDRIHVLAAKTKLPMISVDEWSHVSNITAADFEGKMPVPDYWQKLFPNKDLRSIADELDSLPPRFDLSIEKGKQIIEELLKSHYKIITEPADRPSEKISPAPIEFKEGYENVVVNMPPPSRPPADWEKIEWQVKQWLEAGKVEKSNSPFNSRVVLAPKKMPQLSITSQSSTT